MSDQLRAGHFLASLNGNLPGMDMSTSIYGDTPVLTTNPRGLAGRNQQQTYDPSNLTMESVQWDKSTYVLLTVLPPTAPAELRSRVQALTFKTLKRSTNKGGFTRAALSMRKRIDNS